jgi:hypothetical protein
LFDPRLCKPLCTERSVIPTHGESWSKKWANWWGGATIASPTREMSVPANQAWKTIQRLADDLPALNDYYLQETEYARTWVRDVIGEPLTTPILFGASGTDAILMASRILAHISVDDSREFWTLTTDEGGSLVPATLRGRDPNQMETVMFQPTTAAYYEPVPVMPYPSGVQLPFKGIIRVGDKTDTQIVDEIRALLSEVKTPGCILLPHVTKTGRILPIREVGRLVSELRAQGKPVYLIIDDIQGIVRVAPEAAANPLSFCDAYLFGSSKALGGMLIASAIAIATEHMDRFVAAAAAADTQEPWFAHFQLPRAYELQLGARFLKPSAVSLPELVSMRAALYHLYLRGTGKTFAERRHSQLQKIAAQRETLVNALRTIPGVEVLESGADRPLVSSIVCFRTRLASGPLKDRLQEGNPIITSSAPIGRYVRLDIPEYRPMPSVDVLVGRLKEILESA